MSNIKYIESRLNALRARKKQVETSDMFNEEEKAKQIAFIEEGIQEFNTRLQPDPAITRMVNEQIAKVNYHQLNKTI